MEKIITYKKFGVCLVFLFSVFSALPAVTQAANLYFTPSSGSYAVGSALPVNIYVSSADQPMNAVSGSISFPADKLELVSFSKTSSIITLWVQEPSFSNTAGTANFEGIVLNPGFTGSSGRIITLNFKVKAAGLASLSFSSGSVLANDGKGTNILADLRSGQFSFGGAVSASEESAAASSLLAGVFSAPEISSPTHPDPDKWYSSNEAKFIWKIPSDVTGVRLSVDAVPYGTPTVIYSPAISEKDLKNLDDGISYFHAQFRNSKGWGKISHFKFKIDTRPPDTLSINFVHGEKTTDPNPIINFNTTDGLSGISYYKIKIGSGDFFDVDHNLVLSNPYSLPTQNLGKNTVVVQAYDNAGNSATAVKEFEILAIETPKIISYKKDIQEGDLLEIRGTAYPDSDVDLFLSRENKNVLEQRTRSNSSGDFTVILSEVLGEGIYDIQVQVTNNRGAKSLPSEKITITVAETALFKIGNLAISFLAVLIPLIALIAVLFFMIWYGWHKFFFLKRRLRKEVHEAGSALHKAFDLLKEDIKEQIKMLEKIGTKRKLTEEEEKIIKKFASHLDGAEKFVKKEIENIEKEVK